MWPLRSHFAFCWVCCSIFHWDAYRPSHCLPAPLFSIQQWPIAPCHTILHLSGLKSNYHFNLLSRFVHAWVYVQLTGVLTVCLCGHAYMRTVKHIAETMSQGTEQKTKYYRGGKLKCKTKKLFSSFFHVCFGLQSFGLFSTFKNIINQFTRQKMSDSWLILFIQPDRCNKAAL